MKYTILALVAALSISANAGETVKADVYCDSTTKVLRTLRDEHGELPILTMRGDSDAKYTLMANQKTKSWTFVRLEVAQGQSCVYATGESLEVYKK